MTSRFLFKSTFRKQFEVLPNHKQPPVTNVLESLDHYFKSGYAAYGLRIKKLYTASNYSIYEARAGLDIRVIWVQTNHEAIFSLVGNHEDVRRFIKNL